MTTVGALFTRATVKLFDLLKDHLSENHPEVAVPRALSEEILLQEVGTLVNWSQVHLLPLKEEANKAAISKELKQSIASKLQLQQDVFCDLSPDREDKVRLILRYLISSTEDIVKNASKQSE